ncbi:hypothetical protein Avbf_11507 [Armadillidium vulgare]|nr:hypothetical protein Avbf_11507 [Armadillidium vulgare]
MINWCANEIMSHFLIKIDRNILDRLEESIDQNINIDLMSPSKFGGKELISIQRVIPKGRKYRRIHDCGLEEIGAADEGWIKNFTLHMLKVSPKLKRIYLLPSIFCVLLKTNHIYLPIVKIIEGKNTHELKIVFKAELSGCKFFTESDLTCFRLNKRVLEVIGQNKHLSFGSSAGSTTLEPSQGNTATASLGAKSGTSSEEVSPSTYSQPTSHDSISACSAVRSFARFMESTSSSESVSCSSDTDPTSMHHFRFKRKFNAEKKAFKRLKRTLSTVINGSSSSEDS